MSEQTGRPDDGERTGVLGRFPPAPDNRQAAPEQAGAPEQGSGERQPTFSAPASGPASSVPAAPADSGAPEAGDQAAGDHQAEDQAAGGRPGTPEAGPRPVPAPRGEAEPAAVRGPGTPAVDGPLLAEAAALRANWQRTQAAFVDDPQAAVTDAADLVEHTAQALIGALRQRQRQLRAMLDQRSADGVDGTGSRPAEPGQRQAAGDVPDTERLRLMMQRYRAVFNQICRP